MNISSLGASDIREMAAIILACHAAGFIDDAGEVRAPNPVRTADGVPIVLGMTVYLVCGFCGVVLEVRQSSLNDEDGFRYAVATQSQDRYRSSTHIRDVFSTRAAAIAASDAQAKARQQGGGS